MTGDIIYRDEAYRIVGCCMQVHSILGAGFLEEVYQEALEREFIAAGIPYEREAKLTVMYRGSPLTKKYFADFVCYGKIIVELKAVSALTDAHCVQVVNYLKATGFQLGLLMNFGNPERLQYVRRVNTAGTGNQNANERESGECARMGRGNCGTSSAPVETLAEIRQIGGDSRSEAGSVDQNANERESGECARMGRGNWGTSSAPRETFAGIRQIGGDSRSEAGGAHD